jgi:hypothetical protein
MRSCKCFGAAVLVTLLFVVFLVWCTQQLNQIKYAPFALSLSLSLFSLAGVVKLMGRSAGFIAAHATLSSRMVVGSARALIFFCGTINITCPPFTDVRTSHDTCICHVASRLSGCRICASFPK